MLARHMPSAVNGDAGLGPCDLYDPVWVKMSSVTGVIGKKRKKPDSKPQSQINKCLNEKRRREQENIYIEELAELISATITEMNSLSVKPDKCAILQETVNQIRRIKQEERSGSNAVQQGEVSSSKPTILAQEVLGPLLLEALDGFLFVVNCDCKLEFVSENVTQFLRFHQDDLVGRNIYDVVHQGDHGRFSSCILPMSVGWSGEQHSSRNRSFTCRLLIKDDSEDSSLIMEDSKRAAKHENMQISTVLIPNPQTRDKSPPSPDDDEPSPPPPSEVQNFLVCVARRIPPNEKTQGVPVEQFTTKLDLSGKILQVNTSGLSTQYSHYLNKDLIGRLLTELCHPADVHKVQSHLKEALQTGDSTSPIYRFRLSPDKYLHFQSKSRRFDREQQPLFIMVTHSIIGDNDVTVVNPIDGGISTSNSPGPSRNTTVNGQVRNSANSSAVVGNTTGGDNSLDGPPSSSAPTPPALPATPTTSCWGNGELATGGALIGNLSRPNSRQSAASTPRPPSVSAAYSPSVVASPSFGTATGQTTFSSSFPFSPLTEGPPLTPCNDDLNASNSESARLRILLTKRPSAEESDAASPDNKHQILKNLLNQEDGDVKDRMTDSSKNKSGNNMLLQLLNEKNDDEDVEQKLGIKNQNELLHQLFLKESPDNKHHLGGSNDNLFKGYCLSQSDDHPRGRKRPSEEMGEEMQPPAKYAGMDPQALGAGPSSSMASSSSNNVSPLCQLLNPSPSYPTLPPEDTRKNLYQKNKMLLSLLAQSAPPTSVPALPSSIISGVPQEQIKQRANWHRQQQLRQQTPKTGLSNILGRHSNEPTTIHEHTAASGSGGTTMVNNPLYMKELPPFPSEPQTTHSALSLWDNTSCQTSDPVLSELLDQVIAFDPESNISVSIADDPILMNLLDSLNEAPPMTNTAEYQADMQEKLAINAIQKALMQCESTLNNPSSPITPPAYSTTYLPPPIYQQPRVRFSNAPSQQQQTIRNTLPPQYNMANMQPVELHMTTVQKRRMLQQQQQQRTRLLQQQQHQQLLIPQPSATVTEGRPIHMDGMLDNTLPPNVSLQRSTSVPDSQLSPSGYGNQMMSSPMGSGGPQISPNQRQPYSPSSQMASPLGQQAYSPVPTMNNFNTVPVSQSRLSPHTMPSYQQSQLSPRIPQGLEQNGASNVLPVYKGAKRGRRKKDEQVYSNQSPQLQAAQQSPQWANTQPNLRVSIQQQNPLLNAQLSSQYPAQRAQFINQQAPTRQQQQHMPQMRSLPSPGTPTTINPAGNRPFMGTPEYTPDSPLSNPQMYQQQPQFHHMRLQRTVSAPSTTNQQPGCLNQRQFGHVPPHYHPPPPHPSQMQDRYCYDPNTIHTAMYGQQPNSPNYSSASGNERLRSPTIPTHNHGGGGNRMTSELVRQELRAMVGARSTQQGVGPPMGNPQGGTINQNINNTSASSTPDIDVLGLSFDLGGNGSTDSDKLWNDLGSTSQGGLSQASLSSPRMDDVNLSSDSANSSLLKKLLSSE